LTQFFTGRILAPQEDYNMPTPKLSKTYQVHLLTAGWSPRTGRFYARDVLRNIVKQFKPGIGEFLFSGERSGLRMNLAEASHRTNRLYLKNDDCELWAEVQALETPRGKTMMSCKEKGTVNVRFDCSLTGFVNDSGEVDPESVTYLRVLAYGE
jgi:hypothetical protein